MKIFNKIVIVSVLLCGFIFVPFALAEFPAKIPGDYPESGPGKWHDRMEKKRQEIFEKLTLSDEQKKQLDENKLKSQETKKALWEQMRSNKRALQDELMKPELNMDKINEVQGELKSIHGKMADERLNSILEVRKILSPEQFKNFLSLTDNRGEKNGPWKGKPMSDNDVK